MPLLTAKLRRLTLALAAAGALGMAGSANAVTYKGKWDPAYGPAMPSLGWKGEAEFEIKPECLSSVNVSGWVSNLFGACANKLSINSALVTLYDLTNAAPDVTLSYASGFLPPGNLPLTLRMYVDVVAGEKTVKAVDGGFVLPEKVTTASAPFATVSSAYAGALYWLGFSGFDSNLTNSTEAEAILASCSYKKFSLECSRNSNTPESRAIMAITPVPEPQAYLMGLVSLAVLGLWARRRWPATVAAAAPA